MPRLQERASEESSSDGDNKGIEEPKMEANHNKSNLDSRTFNQVLRGTPASNSDPPNYDEIITNKYDPLIANSDLETATHVDDSLKGPFNLDSDSEMDTRLATATHVDGHPKDPFNFNTDSEPDTRCDISEDIEDVDICDEVEKFLAQQDTLNVHSKEESSLDAEAEIAYEDVDRYQQEGQQYEAEEQKRKDKAEGRRQRAVYHQQLHSPP